MTTGSIPQDVIEQVRQATDIAELIGQFVRLRKRGRNFTALCPFHVEKTPSFSVSSEKQIYHCFGCGKGGNAFTFLMEHESMSFVEAVRFLARKANITIPEKREDFASKEELERLHYANQVALSYFREMLHSARYKTQIMPYLKSKRRLSEESISFFQLGVAGEEWDGLLNYALKRDLFTKDLEKAGLISRSEKNDKYYDRFRQRLMIPIFNLSDKPIAFGGRALKKGEPAKYINSPETLLYSKSNVLYGLNFTKQYIREKNEVIIVEGYFDLISLYQAGVRNVVASSGTAFTPAQARLLARFADTVFLFFDADSAGQAAAVRSVDALYDAEMEVMVMVPPPGEDPDSVAIKSGVDGIEMIKGQARRYLHYRTEGLDLRQSGIIAREKLIKELAELAGRIADPTRRRVFVDEAAERINADPQSFYQLLPSGESRPRSASPIPPPRKLVDVEKELLSLIMSHPDQIENVWSKLSPEDFQDETTGRIYSLILTVYRNTGAVSESALIDLIEDKTLAADITSLLKMDWSGYNIAGTVKDYIKKLFSFKRERAIDQLKAELKMAENRGDSEKARQLAEELTDLISRRGEA